MGSKPIYGYSGGQITKFWPKMIPNIDIMKITSQFEPFDCVKWPQNDHKSIIDFFKNNAETVGLTL